MARQVKAIVKLQLPAGQATPGQPVGPALGGTGVNIVEFTKQYNERTREQTGSVIPVEITVFDDRSFTFVTKTPPVADLLRKAAGAAKGSGNPRTDFVGTVSAKQVRDIAQVKLPDLNANDMEAAESMVRGAARSMGIRVEG